MLLLWKLCWGLSFSIIFGAALLYLDSKGGALKKFVQEFNDLFLLVTHWIMNLSPIGVFALLASLIGQTGFSIFKPVAFYVLTVLVAIFIHLAITLVGIFVFIGRYSPLQFFIKMFPAIATAFPIDGSIATLPVTMDCLEKNVGVSKKLPGLLPL